MSIWSYISGTITLDINGISQPHNDYLLKETLQHLPDVIPNPYSEHHFDIFINTPTSCNVSNSHDEFMICVNSPKYNIENMNRFAVPNTYRYHDNYIETNTVYILTVNGVFRDCTFNECLKSFSKWMNRLAKRLLVTDVFVRISCEDNKTYIINDNYSYGEMYEFNGREDSDYCNWTDWMYPELLNRGRFAKDKYDSVPRLVYKYYLGKKAMEDIESDIIMEYNREKYSKM